MKVEDIEAVVGGKRGAWDYQALAKDLKNAIKTPGAKQVLLDEVLKYHTTRELKHKAHYAKKAIVEAATINGWEITKIATTTVNGRKYIQFEVSF